MADATRQHHKLATGESLQKDASGPPTRAKYAVGGHVHGSHGHSQGVPGHGSHGHSGMKHKRSNKG